MTIDELFAEAQQRLAGDTVDLDTAVLLGYVLKRDRPWLLAHGDETVDAATIAHFQELVARRMTGEPVAYLVGHKEFYGREFMVTPDVLVPRPETELLVEAALKVLRPGDAVADIGTGSGCIGITLALERRDVEVYAIDISPAALAVAQKNADTLSAQLTFYEADLWPGNLAADVMVANLPYVPEADYAAHSEIHAEPKLALAAGPDGLDVIRRLLDRLSGDMPRVLLLEINPSHADWLAQKYGATIIFDLAGRPRIAQID